MPAQVVKDNGVGRIWNWLSTKEKKDVKDIDVVLPHGFLYYNERANYHVACNTLNHVVLLSNHDLIIGPNMDPNKEKEADSQAWRDFFRDALYLKHAVMHGTINLDAICEAK